MYLYLTQEFKKLNQEVPNIHYGGCTIFAEGLYKMLIGLGKKPRVIMLTTTKDSLNFCINNRVTNFDSGQFVVVNHCVIEVDGRYIDNNGMYGNITEILHFENAESDTEVVITIEDLEFINETFIGWNIKFDRKQITSVLERLNKLKEILANMKTIPYLCIEPIN